MDRRNVEPLTATGSIAVPPLPPPVTVPGRRDPVEPWRRVPLRWADASSRSLLLTGLSAGAVLVAYGITLLLEQPPAAAGLLPLRLLAVGLLACAVAIAPATSTAKWLASWVLVMHAIVVVSGVVMVSTEAFGRLRISAVSAVEFAGFITWVAVLLLVRMRHPATIVGVLLVGCLAGLAFFGRVLPEVRGTLESAPCVDRSPGIVLLGGDAAACSVLDEAIASVVVVGVGVLLVLLAWWVDSWVRPLLPLTSRDASLPTRSERRRLRLASVLSACMLDPVAIVLVHIAKQETQGTRMDPREDWFATVLLGVAYVKVLLVWVAATTLAIWLLDPSWT